jgi:hypothetical protein
LPNAKFLIDVDSPEATLEFTIDDQGATGMNKQPHLNASTTVVVRYTPLPVVIPPGFPISLGIPLAVGSSR